MQHAPITLVCNVLFQPCLPPPHGFVCLCSRSALILHSPGLGRVQHLKNLIQSYGLHQLIPAIVCAGDQQAKIHLLLQDNFPRAWKANTGILRHSTEQEIACHKESQHSSCISTLRKLRPVLHDYFNYLRHKLRFVLCKAVAESQLDPMGLAFSGEIVILEF